MKLAEEMVLLFHNPSKMQNSFRSWQISMIIYSNLFSIISRGEPNKYKRNNLFLHFIPDECVWLTNFESHREAFSYRKHNDFLPFTKFMANYIKGWKFIIHLYAYVWNIFVPIRAKYSTNYNTPTKVLFDLFITRLIKSTIVITFHKPFRCWIFFYLYC